MTKFEIVAHRGVSNEYSENTIPSFNRAVEMGADAVELDIRLTADNIPVVYHYFYLNEVTSLSGPIFNYTYDQLLDCQFVEKDGVDGSFYRIPTLEEVLEAIGGKIGLEIEIKGPELEAPSIIADVLGKWKHIWETIELTSYEPIMLINIKKECPGIATDLLFPRSESWMEIDVVTYLALHRAKLANARAVHLHPTQLTQSVVEGIRSQGVEVHAWDINDKESLKLTNDLEIPKICTDKLQQAIEFRNQIK